MAIRTAKTEACPLLLRRIINVFKCSFFPKNATGLPQTETPLKLNRSFSHLCTMAQARLRVPRASRFGLKGYTSSFTFQIHSLVVYTSCWRASALHLGYALPIILTTTMSTEYVRFTVKVLPAASRRGDESCESEESMQTLAVGARQSETFEELRQKVEARFNTRNHKGNGQISQLQDSTGADIFEEDPIGSLYDGSAIGQQHVLYARLVTSDAGRSAVTGTEELRAKRRASDEGLLEERESPKRRKVHPQRDQVAAGQQSDADGFKIPRRRPQGDGGAFNSDATAIVEDSQPETAPTAAGSALAKLQQRKSFDTSSPAQRSSPLIAAASKTTGIPRKVFPTPQSRDRPQQDAHDDTPDQPMSNGRRVLSWFKRHTPAKTTSAPGTTATQEDPIEDNDPSADAFPAAPDPQSAIHPGFGNYGDHTSRDQEREVRKIGANHRLHLRGEVSGTLRTPSVQRSKSTQTEGSQARNGTGASDRITNTARSVAQGWTKAEDDALLAGVSSGKGKNVGEVLKEYKINRTTSAARSRLRLLMQQKKDRQMNTLNFPSSSLAMPQSESEEEPSNTAKKTAVKRWSQNEIGTLRKAIADGLDAREAQARYFNDRSEDSVTRKMREFQKSVIRIEKDKDSFPNNHIGYLWTDQHNLKLRRAYREGLNAVAAGFRYFKSMPKSIVEQNMKAYRQQMEDLNVERAISQQSSPGAARTSQPFSHVDDAVDSNEGRDANHQQADDLSAVDNPPQTQDDVDAEILRDLEALEPPSGDEDDGPIVHDSYDAASAAVITSSPPLLSNYHLRSSPEVVIPPAEQRIAQQAQRRDAMDQQARQPQLRKSTSSGRQTQLNFKRDKGKGAARPVVDVHELDRQHNRQPPRTRIASREQMTEQEMLVVSSDEAVEDDNGSEGQRDVETPKALPRLDSPASAQRERQRQQISQHSDSDSAESDGNATVSSGGPNRQLAFELEQSMSAAEQSTQSQANRVSSTKLSSEVTSPPAQPTGYVYIPSPRRGASTSKAQKAQWQECEDEDDAFQTQDPRNTLSQQQKRKKTSPRSAQKAMTSEKAKPSDNSSDEESSAFQTQDPRTTLSQKQNAKPQRRNEPARTATSMLQDAVNRFDASHGDVVPEGPVSKVKSKGDFGAARPRRNVYDIPVSSQSAAGSQSQRVRKTLPPSTSERRAPGQLPRIIGSASRLAQRKKDAEAKIAARKAEREARSLSAPSLAAAPQQAGDDVEEVPRGDLPSLSQSPPAYFSAQPPKTSGSPEKPSETGLLSDDAIQIQQMNSTSATATANASYDAPSQAQTQTQVQIQPVVELPYPQILSRDPGPNGKLEVGRPGRSFKVPQDCTYLRTEQAIFSAASRETTGTRQVMRRAEDMKLSDQQAVAMACNDSDKLKELHKLERRQRRERRVEDGMPPSRGPAQQPFWHPGIPKPIEWDVNVMPDSDDSMSSRGRDMDEVDEEMEEMEEARSAEMDDDDNPAYFERDRHFSEVEEESDEEHGDHTQRLIATPEDIEKESYEEQADRTQRLINDAEKVERESKAGASESGSSDDDSDEAPDSRRVNAAAIEQTDEDHIAPMLADDVSEHGVVARTGSSSTDAPIHADVEQDAMSQPQSIERIEEDGDLEEEGDESAAAAPVSIDLSTRSVAKEENQDEDDAELPTAPPPVSDDIDEDLAPPPSDRELQDLVQSGDVEIRDEESAPSNAGTRFLPGLGDRTSLSQEGALNDNSLATTTSFSQDTTEKANERTAEDHEPQHAIPDRHSGLADNIVPPWPSSGKVRSSLEASSTPALSDNESNMAFKKQMQTEPGNGKKRKLETTEEECAEHKASRKARKHAHRRDKKVEKQSFVKHSTPDVPSTDQQQATVAKAVEGLMAAKSAVPEPAPAAAELSSKKKRNKNKNKRSKKDKEQQQASDTNTPAASVQQPKQVRPDDRIAMPPPALPPQHSHVMQQSSLPSPDSEFSAKFSRSAKKTKKRAAKKARRDARRSSMSVSVNDSMTSDASISLPVASSPPALAVLSAKITSEPAKIQSSVDRALGGPTTNPKQLKGKTPSPKLAPSNETSHDSLVKQVSKKGSGNDAHHAIERPNSQQTSQESKKSSPKKATKTVKPPSPAAQQLASAPATDNVAKSAEKPEAGSVDRAPESSAVKKTKPKITPISKTMLSQSNDGSAQLPKAKGNGSKPGLGARTGLKGLVDFQAHIPDAPKARPQAEKAPVKPSLFEDDDDDSDSSSDSES